MKAQDPDEPFDLYDREGRPLGRSKARALVHRDGDWHRSVHVWVALDELGVADAGPGPWLLFQRRSLAKDTWPGAIDIAVTGHLRAGEGVAESLREAEEEIGLRLAPGDVVELGLRRRADERRPGIRDFELQTILFTRARVRLGDLRPHPAELSAILALRLDDAEALVADGARVTAVRLGLDGSVDRQEVGRADLVPSSDGYLERALSSVAMHLRGGAPPYFEIG